MTLIETPDYKFLDTGELQYQDCWGRSRVTGGCKPDDGEAFLTLREQAIGLLDKTSDALLEDFYQESLPFRKLCDRCLSYAGIHPETVTPRQEAGLLFARQAGNTLMPAPLVVMAGAEATNPIRRIYVLLASKAGARASPL